MPWWGWLITVVVAVGLVSAVVLAVIIGRSFFKTKKVFDDDFRETRERTHRSPCGRSNNRWN